MVDSVPMVGPVPGRLLMAVLLLLVGVWMRPAVATGPKSDPGRDTARPMALRQARAQRSPGGPAQRGPVGPRIPRPDPDREAPELEFADPTVFLARVQTRELGLVRVRVLLLPVAEPIRGEVCRVAPEGATPVEVPIRV